MGAAIDAIDHGIGRAFQFVVEAPIDQPTNYRHIEAFGGEDIAGRTAFDAALGQRAVHPLDDIAALAEFAQVASAFVSIVHWPGATCSARPSASSLRSRPTFSA